jgi:type I restriction enzyme S subunit
VCSGEFVPLVRRDNVSLSYIHSIALFDDGFWDHLLAHTTGTTGSRQRVRPAEMLDAPIVIPTAAELEEYEQLVAPIFDRLHQLQRESLALARVRDGLLPKLISGELVPANDRLAGWAPPPTRDGVAVG